MDNVGFAWIKSHMSANPGEGSRQRIYEVIKAPTKFLQECLDTCELAFQQAPTQEINNWGDLAAALSTYESFCGLITEKIAEFSQAFDQCIAQLGKLHAKYEPLACVFHAFLAI